MWACVDGSHRSRNKRNLVMWGRYPQAAFQPREAYVRPWEGNPSWQRQECVSNTRQWVTSRTPQWDVVFTWVNLSPRLHIALLFEAGAWWNDRSVRRQRSEQSGEQTTSSSEGNILYPVSHCCCFANEASNRTCDFSHLELITDMMFSGLVQWGKQICLNNEIIVQLPNMYCCRSVKWCSECRFTRHNQKWVLQASAGQLRRWFAVVFHLWVKSQWEQIMAENSRRGRTAGCKGHLVETQGSLHDILLMDQLAAHVFISTRPLLTSSLECPKIWVYFRNKSLVSPKSTSKQTWRSQSSCLLHNIGKKFCWH